MIWLMFSVLHCNTMTSCIKCYIIVLCLLVKIYLRIIVLLICVHMCFLCFYISCKRWRVLHFFISCIWSMHWYIQSSRVFTEYLEGPDHIHILVLTDLNPEQVSGVCQAARCKGVYSDVFALWATICGHASSLDPTVKRSALGWNFAPSLRPF